MTSSHHLDRDIAREGGRILTFFGILIANLVSMGATLFWLMGATHLLSNTGGHLNMMQLGGLELTIYWVMPVIVVLSLVSWIAYRLGFDLIALAIAGSPIAVGVLYYLWLVLGRG